MKISTIGFFASMIAALVAGGSSASSAAVIYQSIPDLAGDPSLNGWCSGCGGDLKVFDTFTLGSDAHLDSINFDVTTFFGGPAQPITLTLYSDAAGLPGLSFFSETSTGPFVGTLNGTSIVTHSLDVTLTAGTYWISYFADDLGIPAYGLSGPLLQLYPDGTYVSRNAKSGFQLNSATQVPEPLSLSLFGTGLAGVAAIRLRRRLKKPA